MPRRGTLVLEDGSEYAGTLFGAPMPVAGEVVFNTGMVGYPETLTDPSYAGQILVATYPYAGNYGVPGAGRDELGLPAGLESERIWAAGLVVVQVSSDTTHWSAERSLHQWMESEGIPGLTGIDARAVAKRIRDRGAMLGKIVADGEDIPWRDPNVENLVAEVSTPELVTYGDDGPRIVMVDTGAKANIVRSFVAAGARVMRVPWDYDFFREEFDGICLPNGPGDPKLADRTIANVRRALDEKIPIFGICLGNQILALAAGADTYKLKFGHRSQNQPCIEVGTRRCYITSQNHGYAVNGATLPEGWREWFTNANDGTNEGIRHDWKPARSVQFHPEATPGPTDTADLFARFVEMLQ
ncbi:MAG: glutamine-hydrolyzing carbamoyl-phosphate synthase small subunit [Acidobacteriota bacterium]